MTYVVVYNQTPSSPAKYLSRGKHGSILGTFDWDEAAKFETEAKAQAFCERHEKQLARSRAREGKKQPERSR